MQSLLSEALVVGKAIWGVPSLEGTGAPWQPSHNKAQLCWCESHLSKSASFLGRGQGDVLIRTLLY